jgi:tetratricopeptide (TPR) repeat protein
MNDRKNIFDTIAFWTLATTTFLLPVFFVSPSLVGLGATKLALFSLGVLIALICFIIERIRQGSVTLPWRPWYLLLALIPVSYLVSSFTGVHWYRSLVGGLFEQDTFHTVALLFVFSFLVMSLANSTKRFWILLVSVIASILLAGIFQVASLVVGPSLSFGALASSATTLVGSWNELTALMVMFLGMALIALETMKLRKWLSITLTALLFFPFFFVVLSIGNFNFDLWFVRFNLPVLIGLLALLIFAYIFSLSKAKLAEAGEKATGRKTISQASLIVLVLSVLLVVFGGLLQGFVSKQTGVTYFSGQPNWQPTYNVATEVLKANPFFGSGPNTFAHKWNLHKPVEFNQLPFWNSNFAFGVGIIPTSAVTLGLVGFILWLIFYGFVISRAARLLFKDEKNGLSPLKVSVAFGVLFTTFLMFFYTPAIVVEVTHFLMLGLLFALDTAGKRRKVFAFDKKQWHHFVSILVAIILLVGVVFWGYIIVQKVAAAYFANQAVTKSMSEEQALQYMAKSFALDPTQPVYGQLVAQIYAAKVAGMASLPSSEITERKDELQTAIYAAINASLTAEQMDPTDFNSQIVTGRLLEYFGSLGIAGAYDQAIQKYQAAAALSPTNPLPFIFASSVSLTQGNVDEAEKHMMKAISLKNNYADSPALAQGISEIIAVINKGAAKPVVVEDEKATTTDETLEDVEVVEE